MPLFVVVKKFKNDENVKSPKKVQDSHGCDHHYFSEQFKPLFTYSMRFKSQKIYAKPGWPGCVMNQQKVQEITERATSVEPSNHA